MEDTVKELIDPPSKVVQKAVDEVVLTLVFHQTSISSSRAKSLNETSISIHEYLARGGLPPEVLENTFINKIIFDGLTAKLKFYKTHEEFRRIALKKISLENVPCG